MPDASDLTTTIETVAGQPAEAEADGLKVKAQSLADLIAADRYLAQKAGVENKHARPSLHPSAAAGVNLMPFSPILGPDGKPTWREPPRQQRLRPAARYDAAEDSPDNRRHWGNSDGFSANAANNPTVRQKLRNRSRYEFDNNGYAHGLILTLANDLIGTGPTLDVQLENEVQKEGVEARWEEWCEQAGFVDQLHTMTQAKIRDGEAFSWMRTNPKFEGVQLDMWTIEGDQVTTWAISTLALPVDFDLGPVDGLKLDDNRNIVSYFVLRNHPGDVFAWSAEYDEVPAADMIHWFRRDRPRQYRGIPEVTAALPLFAMLRRYTLATLAAAETAANFAAMLETEAPADGVTTTPTPFETLEIERNMMTTLPAGSIMKQLKAEQPVSTYSDFKRELLKEIGRPVNAPYNVVSGDSSPYNYSSAKLDLQLRVLAKRVEREHCRHHVLSRVYGMWEYEARLIPGYLPAGLPDDIPYCWYWPGSTAIDPLKEALADEQALASGTTTLAELLSEYGQDWQDFLAQRAKEMARMEELGLPLPAWMTGGAKPASPDTTTGQGPDNPAGKADPRLAAILRAMEQDEPRNGNGRAH